MSWTKVNSSKLSARKNSVWSSKLSLCKENLFWVMKFKIDSPRWYIFWVSILELLTELKTPKVFWIVCTCTGKIRIEIIWGKASLPPSPIYVLWGGKRHDVIADICRNMLIGGWVTTLQGRKYWGRGPPSTWLKISTHVNIGTGDQHSITFQLLVLDILKKHYLANKK